MLTQLGAEGLLVRGRNTGHWRIWRARVDADADLARRDPGAAGGGRRVRRAGRRWLRTFGPGTETDIVWWLGATKGAVRAALAAVEAVEVAWTAARPAGCCPTTSTRWTPVEPWAALLPVLDPTVMGWKERGFYLGASTCPYLFDTNGNAGTTAWWDGRVVGCWVQDEAGVVEVRRSRSCRSRARRPSSAEAERLTAWLDGVRISTVYPSQPMKVARAAGRPQ